MADPKTTAGADAALVVKGEMEMADFMSKWSLSEPMAEAYVAMEPRRRWTGTHGAIAVNEDSKPVAETTRSEAVKEVVGFVLLKVPGFAILVQHVPMVRRIAEWVANDG